MAPRAESFKSARHRVSATRKPCVRKQGRVANVMRCLAAVRAVHRSLALALVLSFVSPATAWMPPTEASSEGAARRPQPIGNVADTSSSNTFTDGKFVLETELALPEPDCRF